MRAAAESSLRKEEKHPIIEKKAAKNMHAHSPAVGSYSFLSMLNT